MMDGMVRESEMVISLGTGTFHTLIAYRSGDQFTIFRDTMDAQVACMQNGVEKPKLLTIL